MSDDQDKKRRTLWGRCLRYWLGPVYYHLGLLDRYGHPSNAKLMYFTAFAVNLIFVMVFGARMIGKGGVLTAVWASWAGLTMAFAGGHQMFKDFVDSRGGGLADAAAKEAEALGKAITERRAAGASEGVEPT